MADTDRELLELAAKAAGWIYQPPGQIDVRRHDLDGWIDPSTGDVYWRDLWNPLTDDGDALRLAVKLFLWEAVRDGYQHVDSDNDFYSATRRAIVRAAAEIGRAA